MFEVRDGCSTYGDGFSLAGESIRFSRQFFLTIQQTGEMMRNGKRSAKGKPVKVRRAKTGEGSLGSGWDLSEVWDGWPIAGSMLILDDCNRPRYRLRRCDGEYPGGERWEFMAIQTPIDLLGIREGRDLSLSLRTRNPELLAYLARLWSFDRESAIELINNAAGRGAGGGETRRVAPDWPEIVN